MECFAELLDALEEEKVITDCKSADHQLSGANNSYCKQARYMR